MTTTLHIPALPGQPVTRENSSCAYTAKIEKFRRMMPSDDFDVDVWEAECEEPPPTDDIAAWASCNAAQAEGINATAEPGDLLLIPFGECQRSIAEAVELPAIEYGIGYGGVFTDARVWESYAWMHTVLGHRTSSLLGADVHATDGAPNDVVIPNFFDVPTITNDEPGLYLLYVGRMIERKGVHIASVAAKRAGVPLLLAGAGDERPEYGEWLGPVGPDDRDELMAGALALITPTRYVEPFGGVAVEAMLTGTPVIASDWGAFTETIEPNVSGYRCRSLDDFTAAIDRAHDIDRIGVRQWATSRYSFDAIRPQYERYLSQQKGESR